MLYARAPRLDAGITAQNAYGQFSADASYARGNENLRLGMNGSLIAVGGRPRAVRQLGEAFAVVSVPGYPGIDVLPRTDLLSPHFAGQPDGRPKGKS